MDTTIDEFILELQQISEDKRKLPLVIMCPNGTQVSPKIKMQFANNGKYPGSPLCGDPLEKMVITY